MESINDIHSLSHAFFCENMIRIVCAAREQEKKRERPGTYSLRFSNRDRHVVVVTEERGERNR